MNYEDMLNSLYIEMVKWFAGDPKRIQHFIKVHSLARHIGIGEGMKKDELFTLEAAAIVHDIGIKPGEELYGRNDGKIQEQLGPDCARKMMSELGFPEEVIERAAYLVATHHTYSNIDELDRKALIEADFLVNLYEDEASEKAVRSAYEKIFSTASGRLLCRTMFSGIQ